MINCMQSMHSPISDGVDGSILFSFSESAKSWRDQECWKKKGVGEKERRAGERTGLNAFTGHLSCKRTERLLAV